MVFYTTRKSESLITLTGQVIRGNQIGREIGFPTANLSLNSQEINLSNGVYAVKVNYNGKSFTGIMNVGMRPTINEDKSRVHYEVHIFDFNKVIYNEILQVEVCFFIREEIAFANLNHLILQIKKDVEFAKRRLQTERK
ncbi:riboflavin kinase [Priestia aryabhattai]|uniref:riboflavin kinase n=1 Tax=Priestia aryabhattai TaxID=412384 RepID=UPI0018738442|nr:riboflavin kinase [Priestia aryabhattai]MBE5097810.1 riboflavin kinase [Priestia aryabhattai]